VRSILLAILVVAAIAITWSLARGGGGGGSNINEREAYWAPRVDAAIKPGASKADLDAFAKANGQRLECYQDGARRDVCSFQDALSQGGTGNLPVRLVVVFVMQGDTVVSHEIGRTSLPPAE
jgi:hypothetical protein